ncbi:hypothetical protein P8452_18732 [Trifolium repens]|nr:hypothetical protein P8452_18732 [Trifolium repens]
MQRDPALPDLGRLSWVGLTAWTTRFTFPVKLIVIVETPVDEHGKQTLNWTKQKLLSIDPIQRVFSYSIIDGNVGFHSYVSTVKVLEKDDGCVIEWFYEVEPVKGWKLEYLDLFIGSGLNEMGQRIQGALKTMEDALIGV